LEYVVVVIWYIFFIFSLFSWKVGTWTCNISVILSLCSCFITRSNRVKVIAFGGKRLSTPEKIKAYSCKQLNVDKISELLPPSFNSWHMLAQKSAIQWQLLPPSIYPRPICTWLKVQGK
jgi:hypothetical protein